MTLISAYIKYNWLKMYYSRNYNQYYKRNTTTTYKCKNILILNFTLY